MTDETKEQEEVKPVEPEPTEKKPEADVKQEKKTFTQDEVNKLLGDRAKRERAKFEGHDEYKAAHDELSTIKEAQKTELEKATERATQAETRADQAEASRVKAERDRDILSKASSLNFADPADAILHIGSDVEDIEAALKELAEQKPYLLKTDKTKTSQAVGNTGTGGTSETREQKRQRLFGG